MYESRLCNQNLGSVLWTYIQPCSATWSRERKRLRRDSSQTRTQVLTFQPRKRPESPGPWLRRFGQSECALSKPALIVTDGELALGLPVPLSSCRSLYSTQRVRFMLRRIWTLY